MTFNQQALKTYVQACPLVLDGFFLVREATLGANGGAFATGFRAVHADEGTAGNALSSASSESWEHTSLKRENGNKEKKPSKEITRF